MQAQATSQGMNPEQAYEYVKQNFMNDKLVYHGTHHGHHNFDSTHGRIGRKAQQAAEIRSGDLMPPEQEEDPSYDPKKDDGEPIDKYLHYMGAKYMNRSPKKLKHRLLKF